jgi:hypothetical protein
VQKRALFKLFIIIVHSTVSACAAAVVGVVVAVAVGLSGDVRRAP